MRLMNVLTHTCVTAGIAKLIVIIVQIVEALVFVQSLEKYVLLMSMKGFNVRRPQQSCSQGEWIYRITLSMALLNSQIWSMMLMFCNSRSDGTDDRTFIIMC